MKVSGEKIRAAMERQGVSREALADKLGCTEKNIIFLEKGQIGTFSVLAKVAGALGVSEAELLEIEL